MEPNKQEMTVEWVNRPNEFIVFKLISYQKSDYQMVQGVIDRQLHITSQGRNIEERPTKHSETTNTHNQKTRQQ